MPKKKEPKLNKPHEVKKTDFSKIKEKMEEFYLKYQTEFFYDSEVKEEEKVIEKISKVIDLLDLGDPNHANRENLEFNTWTAEKLISAREKLARFSEYLGEFISYHEVRSDFAYIWRKGAYASDWLPAKIQLGNTLDKVTNAEVDSTLVDKYLGEHYYSMFHRRRADYLIRKLEAMGKMNRTIDHRLKELSRQNFLPQDPNYTPKP